MRITLVLSLLTVFWSCAPVSPTEVVVPFEPGKWSGTFIWTDEGNPRLPRATAQGVITFFVSDTFYHYNGVVQSWTGQYIKSLWLGPVENCGTFKREDQSIDFTECYPIFAHWQSMLGMWGEHQYTFIGRTLTITQSSTSHSIILILEKDL